MPGGDRTGPEGSGSRTGRMLGFCCGYNSPGYTKGMPRGGRGYGRGFGRGFGHGRGYGYRYRAYPFQQEYPSQYPSEPYKQQDDEKNFLEQRIGELEGELSSLRDQLEQLSKKNQETP